MSEQGAAPEGGDVGAPEAPAFDPSTITQGFEQLRSGMEELRQDFTQSRQPEPEPEQDPGDMDMSWLDQSDPDVDPAAQQQALQAWQQSVMEQASRPAQEAMQAVQEMRMQQEAAALVADFPELGQPETAQNVVGAAHEFAAQMGLNQQDAQRLGDSPGLWRMVYMASKAEGAASGEDSAADATFIEGGNGPGPGAPRQDPADLIVGARGANVLPF